MKKTIVIITNRLVIGGITNDVISLAHRLKNDFNIFILYGDKEPDEREAIQLIKDQPGLTFRKIPTLRKSINLVKDVKAYKHLLHAIKKINADIVHTHGSKSGFLGRLAAHKNKVPCIIHTFHGHVFHSYYNRFVSACILRFEQCMARITTTIIAISDQQGKELREVYKIAQPEKIKIINLGIENSFFNCSKYNAFNFRTQFGFAEDVVTVGIIGRIVAIKNFERFVDIAKSILSSCFGNKVKFFVIGDGKEKEKVQQNLDRRNIKWCTKENYSDDAQIIFTSWLSSVNDVLKELDIVMLTSKNEGTPLSLIEAQYCGKPVIATDAGGVRDTFINEETGFLIPQHNIEMFVSKLSLLITDKTLRETMGKKAAIFAAQKFSKETEVQNIKQLYSNCKTTIT